MNNILKKLKDLVTFDKIKGIENSLIMDGVYGEIKSVLDKIKNQKKEYQEKRSEITTQMNRLESADKVMEKRLDNYSDLEDKFEQLLD